jgi:hypothetical protein
LEGLIGSSGMTTPRIESAAVVGSSEKFFVASEIAAAVDILDDKAMSERSRELEEAMAPDTMSNPETLEVLDAKVSQDNPGYPHDHVIRNTNLI